MLDYQPIDLGLLCNAGGAIYGPKNTPPMGQLTFHGLPFQIGGATPDPARCFIALGPESAAATLDVPVGSIARHVLFAHALLDSHLLENAQVGAVVAHYSMR